MGARPGRTVGQGSPDEGADDTILIFLGALTIPVQALTKVEWFHLNLGMKATVFLLKFNVQESEFLVDIVQGGVSNKGIP